ncbi:amidohydrolase family protein [Falsiroseomonas sp. HW251]|uniref:amidohydrolase family protein n=1 Tax=Falsiroseomonas sp. HW251 TaxID=3390998 RepID=UPI003D31268A
MTTALLEGTTRDAVWTGLVIDCDVHANVPSLTALDRYLDPVWVVTAKERGWKGPVGLRLSYPPGAPTTARAEWRHGAATPASDLATVQKEILDPWRVERAVLNCYYAIDAMRHPDWAAALSRAVNDWLIDEWLSKDPRLVASLVVPARDPVAAATEIDRVGHHPGFVQVLMPVRSERGYGQRIFWPIYEAMARHDLVMGIHWGGQAEQGPSPTGFASWYIEEYAAEPQVFAAQLTSLVIEGVFQKFPSLRVSMLEGGFTWLPTWAWNLNKKWKGLRRDFPWVDRLPTEIIRDHFRFSIAPTDMGPPDQMKRVLHWLGSEDMLMFATDYPHLHTDDLAALLALMAPTMKANVMSETARRWYRL